MLAVWLIPQTAVFSQSQAIGLKLGLANYQGDLVEKQLNLSETNLSAGAFLRKNLTPELSIRFALDVARISGSDFNYPDRKARGLSFTNDIFAASINGQWNILGTPRFDRNREFKRHFSPIVFSGLGAVMFSAKCTGHSLDAPELSRMGGRYSFFVPFGIGGQYELNPNFTLGLEAATHLPFTDDLDGVCESGRQGNNDWFGLVSFTVQYWIDPPQPRMKKKLDESGLDK